MRELREKVLAFFDPGRSMLFFVVGTAALTVAIQVIYDTVRESWGLQGAWLLAACLLVIAATAIVVQMLRRRIVGRVGISEELKPPPQKGLLLLISARENTAPHAIDYHLQDDTLQHCWLIASPESRRVADAIKATYQDRVPHIHMGENYQVDADQIQDSYRVVNHILRRELPAAGLSSQETIADITGGQKPMTAGMALACLARDQKMQYMKARRGPNGEPDTSVPPEPLSIDVTFVVDGPLTDA